MAKRIYALVNPNMLQWARKKCGFDLVGASKRIGVKAEQVEAWENGEKHPTINQAMKMAEVYRRPLSLFYLDEQPKDFSVSMTDYRHLPDKTLGEFSPGLIWEKRQSELRREIMIDLADEDEGVFPYLNTASLEENPEEVANRIREWTSIDWDVQRKWSDYNDAFNTWKFALENLNVLVFQTSHLVSTTFTPEEARGFSIRGEKYPVIMVNSGDAHGARIFTLLHEFVHLLLDTGGICDLEEYLDADTIEQKTEVFCNHVAGSTLVPADILASHNIVQKHGRSVEWDDEEIWNLSVEFSVSEEVIVRRLLILGFTSHEFYEIKRQDYHERWVDYKEKRRASPPTGFPPYHRLILRKNGKFYTRQVFGAYYDKRLTLSAVADYLGVKVKHLRAMEHEAYTGAGI